MTDLPLRSPAPDPRAALLPGAVLAYGVGAALHRVHAGAAHGDLDPVLHWLRDSTLALPLAVTVVVLATAAASRVARRLALAPAGSAGSTALLTAVLYAVAMVPAGRVHAALLVPGGHSAVPGHAHPGGASASQLALLDVSTALAGGLVLLLALAGLRTAAPGVRAALGRRLGRRPGLVAVLTAGALMTSVAPAAGVATTSDPEADVRAAVTACGAGTADRRYDVAAIDVHVPYNRWGQGNPDGMVFVLQADAQAVRDWHRPLGTTDDDRRLRPRPLVLRANEGECVEVRLTNELALKAREGLPTDPRVSMDVRGVPYDVQTSGGAHAGYSTDTTLGRGQSTTMHWVAPGEGTYFFSDTAMPAGSEADGGGLAQGLYGALVVEPAGSTWSDPRTGRRLYEQTGGQSGELYLEAVIDPPTGRTFRESVQLAQDELPHTSTFAFNYGSEPQELRESAKCPDCVGEETSLSSWAYGDPAMVKLASGLGPWKPRTPEAQEDCGLGTQGFDADSCFTSNVTHAYAGDPFKFRYGMAGGKETHVFHLHAHQWLAEDADTGAAGPTPSTPGPGRTPQSTTIDSQTFGPMETFTADLLFGAGSRNRTIGDAIFHCHLYPHFAAGFWSLLRVHDVREDGTMSTPDGVRVAALLPLGDVPAPPAATDELPGYPRFIPGRVGWRAPAAAARRARRRTPRRALCRRPRARELRRRRRAGAAGDRAADDVAPVRRLVQARRAVRRPLPDRLAPGPLQGVGDPDRPGLQRARRPRHAGTGARARPRRRRRARGHQEARAAVRPRQRGRLRHLGADEPPAELVRQRRVPAAHADQHVRPAHPPREVRRARLRRRLQRLELPAGGLLPGADRVQRGHGGRSRPLHRRRLPARPAGRLRPEDQLSRARSRADHRRAVVRRLRAADRLHPRPPLRRRRPEPRPVRRRRRRAQRHGLPRPAHRRLPAAGQLGRPRRARLRDELRGRGRRWRSSTSSARGRTTTSATSAWPSPTSCR